MCMLRASKDEAIRKMVMRRLRRCRTRPIVCAPDVLSIYRDRRAFVSTRAMAFLTLCRLMGGLKGACRAVVFGLQGADRADASPGDDGA